MEFTVIKGLDYLNNECDVIQKIEDDGTTWSVPTDPANSDYQRYLNPEAEQSTPIVTADE
jgi:hypothetical protein